MKSFAESYKPLFASYVKPSIGKLTMVSPHAEHSFMTHGAWRPRVVDAMPKRMDEPSDGQMQSGIRQAIVACSGEVGEATWRDCLQGSPDDPTQVT